MNESLKANNNHVSIQWERVTYCFEYKCIGASVHMAVVSQRQVRLKLHLLVSRGQALIKWSWSLLFGGGSCGYTRLCLHQHHPHHCSSRYLGALATTFFFSPARKYSSSSVFDNRPILSPITPLLVSFLGLLCPNRRSSIS